MKILFGRCPTGAQKRRNGRQNPSLRPKELLEERTFSAMFLADKRDLNGTQAEISRVLRV